MQGNHFLTNRLNSAWNFATTLKNEQVERNFHPRPHQPSFSGPVTDDFSLFTDEGVQRQLQLLHTRRVQKQLSGDDTAHPTCTFPCVEPEIAADAVMEPKLSMEEKLYNKEKKIDKAELKKLLFSEEEPEKHNISHAATEQAEEEDKGQHESTDKFVFGGNLFLRDNTITVARQLLHDGFFWCLLCRYSANVESNVTSVQQQLYCRKELCLLEKKYISHCKYCVCRLDFELLVAEWIIENVVASANTTLEAKNADLAFKVSKKAFFAIWIFGFSLSSHRNCCNLKQVTRVKLLRPTNKIKRPILRHPISQRRYNHGLLPKVVLQNSW